jgi:transcription elongation factor Elf1
LSAIQASGGHSSTVNVCFAIQGERVIQALLCAGCIQGHSVNYAQLQREIDAQNEWADVLARHPEQQRDDREPMDSQRNLLRGDDRKRGH